MSEPWTEAQLDSVRRLRYDHGGEKPVPIGAASSVERDSWLHWAPLPPGMGSCKHEACCCDKHCTCQDEWEPQEC